MVDSIAQLRALATRVQKLGDQLRTEEGTKHALVLPFIAALGYNVFDPCEVMPELVADVGVKKGEKVDYAIMLDGKPAILFECKAIHADLDREHASQLFRYFSVTPARIGVLTNGVVYRFYTDLDEPNKMDAKPFFEVDIRDIKDHVASELLRFGKSGFDSEAIVVAATELRFTKEVKRLLNEQLNAPSEDFVRFFAQQIYSGVLTKSVRAQFADITRKAMNEFINDRLSERLTVAFAQDQQARHSPAAEAALAADGPSSEPVVDVPSKVVTTGLELEAYHLVKAILRDTVEPGRVALRDTASYCGVLLDDTNRKPICRLHFNSATNRAISLFVVNASNERVEERVPLADLYDLFKLADKLKAIVAWYDSPRGRRDASQHSDEASLPPGTPALVISK